MTPTPEWWYYTVELPDGLRRGIYPDTLPMLPRILLDRCDIKGLDFLDVGCMEGLMPALAVRRGARVLAVDMAEHCRSKLDLVRSTYGEFAFQVCPHAYLLHRQIMRTFDIVNLSGLLYHVASPLLVLIGVRPLLKMGGFLIVGTNVIAEHGYAAHFNAHGKMQAENNTFWYPTVDLLEYLLRMTGFEPVDALFLPHEAIKGVSLGGAKMDYVFDRRSGYLTLACRATEQPQGDDWMRSTANMAQDFRMLGAPWQLERSSVEYQHGKTAWEAIASPTTTGANHVLRLTDV